MEASTLEKLAMEEKKREEVSKIMFVLLRKEYILFKCDGLLALNLILVKLRPTIT